MAVKQAWHQFMSARFITIWHSETRCSCCIYCIAIFVQDFVSLFCDVTWLLFQYTNLVCVCVCVCVYVCVCVCVCVCPFVHVHGCVMRKSEEGYIDSRLYYYVTRMCNGECAIWVDSSISYFHMIMRGKASLVRHNLKHWRRYITKWNICMWHQKTEQ